MLLSQRKYAKYRRARGLPGGTLQAVQKAIAGKRITLVIDPESKRLMIDPAIADAQWERNTDPDQQLRGNGGVLPLAASLALEQLAATAPGGDEIERSALAAGSSDKVELLRHKRESAELDTELKRIELARLRKELVSLADDREVRTRRYRALREKLQGIPDREAVLAAAELGVDAVQMHSVLDRLIKRALHELSDDAHAEADRGIAEPVAA